MNTRYLKAYVAVAGALVAALLKAFPDVAAVQTWGSIASAVLTAILVYAVPNSEPPIDLTDDGHGDPDDAVLEHLEEA